jgi:transcriptional regulator of heat shock response
MKNLGKALAELSGGAALISSDNTDTFYTGLSQLFAQPEFQDMKRVMSVTDVLDHLDEVLHLLRRAHAPSPQVLLGNESPFGPGSGMIVASNNNTMIGILGPVRMDYQSAMSLLSSALNLLDES